MSKSTSTPSIRAISSNELIRVICKALNMDYRFIHQMEIILIPGEPAMIEIERVADSRLLELNWEVIASKNEADNE